MSSHFCDRTLGNCFLGEGRWKSRWPDRRAGEKGLICRNSLNISDHGSILHQSSRCAIIFSANDEVWQRGLRVREWKVFGWLFARATTGMFCRVWCRGSPAVDGFKLPQTVGMSRGRCGKPEEVFVPLPPRNQSSAQTPRPGISSNQKSKIITPKS